MIIHRKSAETPSMNRRQFLQRGLRISGLGLTPWLVSASTLGMGGGIGANSRIAVGLIGRGAMGSGHLFRLTGDSGVELLAICDVDQSRRSEGQQQVNTAYQVNKPTNSRGDICQAYNDYRDLLARSDIDGVVIATPDHWHSLMAIDAARAGKDIYCEKPISLTIREGRRVVEHVRRAGKVFQTGTQYRSIPTIRHICEFIRRGGLGKIRFVFTLWGKYDIPTLGPSYVPLDPVLESEPVPNGLDWDLWVGPASWRPYNRAYHRNPSPGVVPWVFCDAFGAVAVTGYQSHAADVIQYALGVEETGPIEIIHPSDGRFPTLTFRYANGTLLHHVDNWDMVKNVYGALPSNARLAGNFGGIFVGERGWITTMSTGGLVEGGPSGIFEEMQLPSREVAIGTNNHHANWFECVRNRSRASAHEEIGHRSASLGHLAIIAYRLGRSLQWDPTKEVFSQDEANRMCGRGMREPWRT